MSDVTFIFQRDLQSLLVPFSLRLFLHLSPVRRSVPLSLSRVIEVISHLEDDEWTGRSLSALPLLSA